MLDGEGHKHMHVNTRPSIQFQLVPFSFDHFASLKAQCATKNVWKLLKSQKHTLCCWIAVDVCIRSRSSVTEARGVFTLSIQQSFSLDLSFPLEHNSPHNLLLLHCCEHANGVKSCV